MYTIQKVCIHFRYKTVPYEGYECIGNHLLKRIRFSSATSLNYNSNSLYINCIGKSVIVNYCPKNDLNNRHKTHATIGFVCMK